MSILELILLFLAASVFGVIVFRMMNLPPMLGYLSVGAIVAPYAYQWIPSRSALEALAEFGIVFLMFSVGLEFSLSKLRRMWRLVFFLGGGQVLLTAVLAMGIVKLIGGTWQNGVLIGAVLAMSSTAIGGKLLAERGEMDTEYGRAMVGIFLLQDLVTVPMLIVLPLLNDMPDDLTFRIGFAIGKIVLVFSLILWLGKPIIQWWFRVVADRRSHELFMLNLFLFTLGAAYFTEEVGLSMALGALLVGMLISGTEFRFQVTEDIQPYEDVLLGLFFITIGMRLNPLLIAENFIAVILILMAILTFKFLIMFVLCQGFDMATGSAIRTSLGIAGAGEFGFVILTVCRGQLPAPMEQPILAAMVLSMFIQPFLILYSDKIVMRFSKSEWLLKSAQITQLAAKTLGANNHVILCGYGKTGQTVGKILEAEKVKFIAIETDPETLRYARAIGDPVEFGDASRYELLVAAGLKRAKALVITFSSYQRTMRILQHVKMIHPNLPVIVRARDNSTTDALVKAGADEVIQDVFEVALMLGAYALVCAGIPLRKAFWVTRSMRKEKYGLVRALYHSDKEDAASFSDNEGVTVLPVRIPEFADSVGKSLEELNLVEPHVVVTIIRRGTQKIPNPKKDMCLEVNDLVVLAGTPNQLTEAEARIK